MSLDRQPELFAQIARTAVHPAPEGWTSITLEVSAMGNGAEVGAIAHIDGENVEFVIDMETGVACLELREAMYSESTGTWHQAIFRLNQESNFDADFDYDAKPYEAEEEGSKDLRDLLMYDQELYPRDNENLPDWHPAKR